MEIFQWIAAAQKGDKEARDTIIEKNTGLVWSIVRRFSNRGYDLEDLFQVGCIGLIKAVDKFNLEYEVEFSTYAVPLITGEIKRFFRDNGMVKVSRTLKENGWKIRKAEDKLHDILGRNPTIMEISKETMLSKEEIVMAIEANAEIESLDKAMFATDGKEVSMLEQVTGIPGELGSLRIEGNEDSEKNRVVDRILVENLLKQLDSREEALITMRFFKDKTQSEVAKQLGISQVQVSRLEKKILKRMREQLQQKI